LATLFVLRMIAVLAIQAVRIAEYRGGFFK
jgi:hypothetical protein